jgi:hypothetical protein
MKKYAADNLLFLYEQYPQIYKYIRNRKPNLERFQAAFARNGEPIISYHPEEGKPVWLNSRYEPSLEAVRWSESLEQEIRQNKDVLICGFGLGYHVQAFLEAYPDKRLYIYEPHIDVFLHAIENRDIRPILDNKRIAMFAIGEDYQTQLSLLEEMLNHVTGTFANLILPTYRSAFPEFVKSYYQTVVQAATAMAASHRTVAHFRDDWIRNMILNMKHTPLTPSFRGMKDSCEGIPAIIVSSGPSLGMEMEALKNLKNRALIIAAGSSVQALQKNGLLPHLAVSMDPGYANQLVFDQVDLEQIPLLFIPCLHHAILEKPASCRMHAFFVLDTPTNYMMNVTGEDPVFQNTGTVSGTAIQAAIYMGCKEIYFIGQDYSFPDDRFYSDGVGHIREEILKNRIADAHLMVPNVQGGMNRTNASMNLLRQGIEQFLDLYPGYQFYNASPVGAVIKHTKAKTLGALLQERSDIEWDEDWFAQRLQRHLKPYTEARLAKIQDRIGTVKKNFVSFDDAFKAIQMHFQSAKERLTAFSDEEMLRWLVEFEQMWSPVVDDESFKHFFAFFLLRELNYIDRHWPDMLESQDYGEKIIKIISMLEPLIHSWEEISEKLQPYLAELEPAFIT